MKSVRWPAVVVTITLLAGVAIAGDDSTGAPQSVSETAPTPPQTSSQEPVQQVEQKPLIDRRDRIFYPGDTERLKPLGRKLFLNVLLDQKEIFTSPFHIDRHNAKWWLLAGATTASLIATDRRIANAFENSRGQVRWGGRISNIGASYTVLPIVAGSYGYGVLRDNAKAREIGVLGTESLLDGIIVAGILKEATRRARPDEPHPGNFWAGGTSFPSGHAIQIWSIASLVSHEYKHSPAIQITAYSLAGIVSAARIAAQKHFASDVVVGGAMGWVIGRYVYQTHMSHLAHKRSSLMPNILPQLDPYQRSYGVTLVFGSGAPVASPGPVLTPFGVANRPY
ncbi:MAG TPA: phosphatase PAP2 family protein [Terriglobales bacterium]